MKKVFNKMTLFLILCSVFLIIGIPLGIYYLFQDGGASLAGTLILIADLIIFLILIIDRALIHRVSPIKLSIYELLFLVLGITIYLYSERKIIIDLKNKNIDYLMVIENSGNLRSNESVISFPFNKNISTERNYVIVDKITKNIEFNLNAEWDNSHTQSVYNFEKYPKVEVFSKPKLNFKKEINQDFIDSLINEK